MAQSIIELFSETVGKFPDAPAMRWRDETDRWKTRTWRELDEERLTLAAGLFELGLGANERANILSNTSDKWMLADLAIQTCGGETVAIYQSLLAHEVEYIVNDCGSVMVFCEDAEQLQKLKEERAKLSAVRKVIVMNDEVDGSDWTIKFSEVMANGRETLARVRDDLAVRTKNLTSNDVLTLIYTSGTTGKPKGVVLTHGNMLYEVQATRDVGLVQHEDVQLLFLPMAHVFAKLLQCVWFGTGHEMAIDADVTRIVENLGDVRPTVAASVPRIFEKVHAKVVGGGSATPGIKGTLFRWAVGLHDQYAQLSIEGKPMPLGLQLQLNLAKKLVFEKVSARLQELFGGRLRFFISGGAPLPKKMAYFFETCGVKILEGYGLTETSAATTVNRPGLNKIGTVGKPMPGTEIKIAEDGEILVQGGGVMREYWNREEATREVLDADRWFHTGDIGVIDPDGYLRITDRKKDIIVTAGGKNVAPQNIENLIKSSSPLISQVMVYGDRRKYLSALITLDPDNAIKFGADNGAGGDYESVTQSSAAQEAIQSTIDAANAQLARYETIKKFKILSKDFEVGEELTPTLKVKRKFANEKYKDVLDGFYDEAVVE